jgi:hypothetical protein
MKALVYLVLSSLIFIQCTKEKNEDPALGRTVTLNTRVVYDGLDAVILQAYDYPQGYKIKFNRMDFMIKSPALNGSVKKTTKDSVYIMKFTDVNNTLATAQKGIDLQFPNASGNFNSLVFGIGLDAATNAKDPSAFPNSSPLSDFFYYWEAWKSYIFLKVEGTCDPDGDGNFDQFFAYHIGSDDLYRVLTKSVSITDDSKDQVIKMTIDLKTLMAANGDFINIPLTPSSHSPKDKPLSEKIANNLNAAITIQ